MFVALESLSEEFGLRKVTREELSALRKLETRKVFEAMGIHTPELLAKVVRRLHQLLEEKLSSMKPFEGVREMLESLKSDGCELGILTSNSTQNVETFLRLNDLSIFDFIRGDCQVFGKAEHLRNILIEKNLHPIQHLFAYVGDETRDVDAARASGYKAVAVSWGLNAAETLEKKNPDLLLHECSEFRYLFWKKFETPLS